jgi:hypothetical protein
MTDTTRPGDPADRATDAKADGAFQGSHRAGYGDRLARVEDWLRRHPDATLQSGEGAVLVEEIDRLRAELVEARKDTQLLDRLDASICSVRPYNPYHAEFDEDARWHVYNPAIKGRKTAGFNAMTVRDAIARALDGDA